MSPGETALVPGCGATECNAEAGSRKDAEQVDLLRVPAPPRLRAYFLMNGRTCLWQVSVGWVKQVAQALGTKHWGHGNTKDASK